MAKLFHLVIVTPEKTVVDEEVSYMAAPGVLGEFGVLPGHLPLLTALAPGKVTYQVGDDRKYAFISGGFAEVAGNEISIMTEAGEKLEDIDVDRAQKACERAHARLAAPDAHTDIARAEVALKRAMQRLHIAALK